MGSRPARWNPPPTRVRLAIAIGLATATLWLAFLAANGPAIRPDTKAYLRVADGFWTFRILTSSRLPGYPLFLVAGRGVASLLATDVATTVAVAQILLLSGLGTALVFTLACRMTGRTAIGFAAALLFAFDVDVQWFGAALLTEALVVTLVLLMAAVRLRDGRWVRASWLLAALALIRPNFAAFPVAFAVFDALRLRTLRALLAPLLPTVAVWAAWWVIASAAGADPSRPQSWFVPIHTFTKVYEGDLWRALPDGPERRLIAEQRAHHVDVMVAAAAVDEASGPGSIRRVAQSAIRADPLGYVRLCLALVPLEYHYGTWAAIDEMGFTHPRETLLRHVRRFHARYRGICYGSVWPFAVLLALACRNGLGWPHATQTFRGLIAPFVVVLLVSVAFSSAGEHQIGRLAIALHPFNAPLGGGRRAARDGRRAVVAAAPPATRPRPGRRYRLMHVVVA